jgi:HEAT repeat protein
LPRLEGILKDDEFTKVVATHAILCIHPPRTEEFVPILIDGLNSDDSVVRQRAAQVLAEIPAAGALAVSSLTQALFDDDEIVRVAVLHALENLGPRAAPAIQALVGIVRDNNDIIERGFAADVLAAIGPVAGEAVPELAKCIEEPGDGATRTFFRLKVANALWQISGEPDHLLAIGNEAAHDSEWWLRHKATICLGEVGPVAVSDLRRLLDDEHPNVRRVAAESLRKIEATA